jgi:hypothetical protein
MGVCGADSRLLSPSGYAACTYLCVIYVVSLGFIVSFQLSSAFMKLRMRLCVVIYATSAHWTERVLRLDRVNADAVFTNRSTTAGLDFRTHSHTLLLLFSFAQLPKEGEVATTPCSSCYGQRENHHCHRVHLTLLTHVDMRTSAFRAALNVLTHYQPLPRSRHRHSLHLQRTTTS